MKPKKTTNITAAPLDIPKNGEWLDTLSENSFIVFPEKADWRKRLIYSLFEWLERSDGIILEDFLFEYKIPRGTFDKWRVKYPDLNEAVTQAKIFMGARRRKGTILNKFNYYSAYRDMHCYDPNWKKEVDEYHAALKANNESESTGNKEYVVIERLVEKTVRESNE